MDGSERMNKRMDGWMDGRGKIEGGKGEDRRMEGGGWMDGSVGLSLCVLVALGHRCGVRACHHTWWWRAVVHSWAVVRARCHCDGCLVGAHCCGWMVVMWGVHRC